MDIHQRIYEWERIKCVDVMNRIGVREGLIVLDFGCGYGHYILSVGLVMKNTGAVYTVDSHAKALKFVA